ncbi:MAG TPA: RAMP superfamily CRISPR-associated protein [Aggregatilineales bacterium]|nr:RAMP superfamily CRISPR-associated protein [Aggregatilineales bacterium]
MPGIDLKITLQAPLHSGGADSVLPVARDGRGHPVITATALKGAHRIATERAARSLGLKLCDSPLHLCQSDPCAVCQIFGSRWTPGRVRYHDLTTAAQVSEIARVTAPQSRWRGCQLRNESEKWEFLPAGAVFNGTIHHFITDMGLIALAIAGLRSISFLGAGRAQGWGLCRVEARALDALDRPIEDDALAPALQRLSRAS